MTVTETKRNTSVLIRSKKVEEKLTEKCYTRWWWVAFPTNEDNDEDGAGVNSYLN